MRTLMTTLLVLAVPALGLAEGPAASAAQSTAAAGDDAPVGLELAPKVGGLVPWSKLGGTWNADLEVGWVTPLLDHQLALALDVGYAQPTHGQTVSDPRVGSGAYQFTLTQRELNLFVGPKYFFVPVQRTLLPWVDAGVKVHLMKSEAVGTAGGEAFGENDETKTQVGGALRGGLGYKLGPGHLFGELELAYGGLDETITGQANVADASLQVGYLFIF